MRRSEALALLRSHIEDIRRFSVHRLALFGSVARDEAGPSSDVDVLVEFRGPATFERYTGLLAYLEDLLRCRVDLLTPRSIKPRLAARIEAELVDVT